MIFQAHSLRSFHRAARSIRRQFPESSAVANAIADTTGTLDIRILAGAQESFPYTVVTLRADGMVGEGIAKRNPIDTFDVPDIAVQIATFRALMDIYDRYEAGMMPEDHLEKWLTLEGED